MSKTRQSDLIRVLDLAALGQAGGQAADLEAQRLGEAADVERGRVALDIGVQGQDQLLHPVQAGEQLLHAQLLGADALQGREHAQQHVVTAAELAAGLDHVHVAGVLDDAEDRLVPARVLAVAAALAFGQIAAVGAKTDFGMQGVEIAAQVLGQSGVGLQKMESQALGALPSHSRQAGEVLDQTEEGWRVTGHGP